MIVVKEVRKLGPIFNKAASRDVILEEQKRALLEIGVYGEAQLKRVANPFGNTGHLENSMFHKVSGATVTIGSPVSYGVVVLETGRKPGTLPPIAPIELWVKRKLRPQADDARISKRTMRRAQLVAAGSRSEASGKVSRLAVWRAAQKLNAEQLVRSVAWAVALAIKKRGLPMRLLVSRTVYPKIMRRATSAVQAAAARITKRVG